MRESQKAISKTRLTLADTDSHLKKGYARIAIAIH